MYRYNHPKLLETLSPIIRESVMQPAWDWLNGQTHLAGNTPRLGAAFAALPRQTGKGSIAVTPEQDRTLQQLRPGLSVKGWSADRLCRVWLLLHLDPSDREAYLRTIESLFMGAEMNELVALYSALPLLAHPGEWRMRCAEGIRSNIGDVLQAIMCHNPYPSEWLEERAWNQMVLKAFFTEKPVHRIIGLDERSNPDLARILLDYAGERWAAHRGVHPLLWRCVAPFLDEHSYPALERLARSDNPLEREAAALVCKGSPYPPARALLKKESLLAPFKKEDSLSWDRLAEKTETAVPSR